MLTSWVRHYLLAALVLPFALLFTTGATAADEVAVPALAHRVTDLTGTLSLEQQAALETKLAQFEQQKGSQIVVLLVPTTQPEDIAQYAIRVFDVWKLGRSKVQDGILILVAKNDHRMRIEVGYGLEGVIPDAIAKRIIAEIMTPHFKQGDFYGGIDAAVDALTGLINGEALPPPPKRQAAGSSSWEGMLPVLLFGGLIIGGLLRTMLGSFLGGAATGGLIGAAVWIFGGSLLIAAVLGIIAFFLTISGGLGAMNMLGGGGFSPGGFGGGGGGFSGGGGSSGGGGASGNW